MAEYSLQMSKHMEELRHVLPKTKSRSLSVVKPPTIKWTLEQLHALKNNAHLQTSVLADKLGIEEKSVKDVIELYKKAQLDIGEEVTESDLISDFKRKRDTTDTKVQPHPKKQKQETPPHIKTSKKETKQPQPPPQKSDNEATSSSSEEGDVNVEEISSDSN